MKSCLRHFFIISIVAVDRKLVFNVIRDVILNKYKFWEHRIYSLRPVKTRMNHDIWIVEMARMYLFLRFYHRRR